MLFYDAPAPPDGLFNMFLDIPNLSQDTKTRTYKEVVAAFSLGGAFDGTR
jgi:hypothetical protein